MATDTATITPPKGFVLDNQTNINPPEGFVLDNPVSNSIKPPEGFILDTPSIQPSITPPKGFVLDAVPEGNVSFVSSVGVKTPETPDTFMDIVKRESLKRTMELPGAAKVFGKTIIPATGKLATDTVGGLVDFLGRTIEEQTGRLNPFIISPEGIFQRPYTEAEKAGLAFGKDIKETGQKIIETGEKIEMPKAETGTEKVAQIVALGLPSTLIAAGISAFNPVLGLSTMGLIQGMGTYKEGLATGKTAEEMTLPIILDAVGTSILEKYPFDMIRKGGVILGSVFEGAEEVVQQAWSNYIAKTNYDEARKLHEGMVESFIGGVGAGGISASAFKTVNKFITKARKSGVADSDIETIIKQAREEVSTALRPDIAKELLKPEISIPEVVLPKGDKPAIPTEETKKVELIVTPDMTIADVAKQLADKTPTVQEESIKQPSTATTTAEPIQPVVEPILSVKETNLPLEERIRLLKQAGKIKEAEALRKSETLIQPELINVPESIKKTKTSKKDILNLVSYIIDEFGGINTSKARKDFNIKEDFWQSGIAKILNPKSKFGLDDIVDSMQRDPRFVHLKLRTDSDLMYILQDRVKRLINETEFDDKNYTEEYNKYLEENREKFQEEDVRTGLSRAEEELSSDIEKEIESEFNTEEVGITPEGIETGFDFGVNTKENITDSYNRLVEQYLDEGLSATEARQLAKSKLSKPQQTTSQTGQTQQQEFITKTGIESFGRGREGEQDLFTATKGFSKASSPIPGFTPSGTPHVRQMPEVVRLYKDLMEQTPIVKKLLKNYGLFKTGSGNIVLDVGIFKNPDFATSVLSHEVGHLIDWLPDKSISRGNILGRIATLRGYMKETLAEYKGAPGELTKEDRARLRKEAEAIIRGEISKKGAIENQFDPQAILDIWNKVESKTKDQVLLDYVKRLNTEEKKSIIKSAMQAVKKGVTITIDDIGKFNNNILDNVKEVSEVYEDLILKEIKKRKLFHDETIRNELKEVTQYWNPFDVGINPRYTQYRYGSDELYAEAMSVLLNESDTLKRLAPEFYRGFYNYINEKSEVADAYAALIYHSKRFSFTT